jgi:uncharacterized membrane protein
MTALHVFSGHHESVAAPAVRHVGPADLADALRRGIADFAAMPSHVIFLCLIYPIVGIVLARLVLGADVLPMLFPLAAGFALVGPLAALGLYEISRRREKGLDVSWRHAFDVLRSPSLGSIIVLGVLLMVIFLVWLGVANAIYVRSFGYAPAASIPDFVGRIFTTPEGRMLAIVGNGVGFLFAVVVLAISAISFPLLLDRDVGAITAMLTSVRAVIANPLTMALWGIIVAVLLALGSIPFFLGLTVIVPVLGHATWHLYRKVVV